MNKEFSVGSWQVDPKQCLLIGEQQEKSLEPKAMSLLLVLAEANGELVSREQLFEAIWQDQVVSDHALNTLIGSLRKSLSDHTNAPQYIETRPKLGYRLAPDIKWYGIANNASGNETSTVNPSQKLLFSKGRGRLTRFSALALSVISIAAIILKFTPFNSNDQAVEQHKSTQHFSEKLPLENTVNNLGVLPENTDSVQPQIKDADISIGHLVKLYVSYTFSELDENGKLYCEDFSYGMINRSIYANGRWRVIGGGVTMRLDHQEENLVNVSETHTMEYINLIGKKEIDITTMNYDKDGQLSGSADIKIFSDSGLLICEGKSVFFGTKF